MKTLTISNEEMLKRVAVFNDLKPLPIQLDKNIPQEGKDIVTNGGRVLALTSLAENKELALEQSKTLAEKIDFEGKYYRKDIGFDL